MSNMLNIREIEKQLENKELSDKQRAQLTAKLLKLREPKGISMFIAVFSGMILLAMLIGILVLK